MARPTIGLEPGSTIPNDAPGQDAPAADDSLSQSMVKPAASSARSGGMFRSSAIYSGLTMVSRFMGFLRDLVITGKIGASASAAGDAYNTMMAFPNLFRRIFAEGAFATAFVPAYSRALATHGEAEADQLAADAMAVLAAATIALTIACCLAMPWLMYVINPGYASDPVKFKLAVTLTQISMPYLPCMAIYAHLSGVLQARGRFIVSAFAPTLMNLVMLVAVWPAKDAVSAATNASWGVIVAGVAQAGLLMWGCKRTGAHVGLHVIPKMTPAVKSLVLLAVPGSIAASATQINIFISGFLASQVNGARSWLAVADRLYMLPLGLVGVAIGVALLPRLSMTIHRKDEAGAQQALDEAIALSLVFSLPAAAALFCMPFFLIDGLFTRGEFHIFDAQATAAALQQYGWGTPAFVLNRILTQAFFARQDTRSPMRFALISVALNIVLGVALFQGLHILEHDRPSRGIEGIAAATSIAAWLNVGQMTWALRKRGWWTPSAATVRRLVRILACAVVMGGALAGLSWARPLFQPWFFNRKEIAVGVTVILGGAIYVVLLPLLRAVSITEVRTALKRQPKPAGVVETPSEL